MNQMTKQDAEAIVSLLWSGEKRDDSRLTQALTVLGISMPTFARLQREARRVERKFSRMHILTPTGHGARV